MHNKLLIADGHAAIVGGRNLADAYFMRSDDANFLDFDLLAVGAVAPVLAGQFDAFWNSRFAVPLQALADNALDAAQRRASFDRLSGSPPDSARHPALPAPVRQAMQALGSVPLVVADAQVLFESPDKTGGQLPGSTLLPVGFIDDRLLLVGSMNLDPRSATTNTKLALAIDSPALVRLILGQFQKALFRTLQMITYDQFCH